VALTWFTIALLPAEVEAGRISRMQDAFAERVMDAGAPTGATPFGRVREDGGVDLYFTPPAGQIARVLLKTSGALACLPPVDHGTMELLAGEEGDQRLLSSWMNRPLLRLVPTRA
jgi:hypothetical protein